MTLFWRDVETVVPTGQVRHFNSSLAQNFTMTGQNFWTGLFRPMAIAMAFPDRSAVNMQCSGVYTACTLQAKQCNIFSYSPFFSFVRGPMDTLEFELWLHLLKPIGHICFSRCKWYIWNYSLPDNISGTSSRISYSSDLTLAFSRSSLILVCHVIHNAVYNVINHRSAQLSFLINTLGCAFIPVSHDCTYAYVVSDMCMLHWT